jgi:hypothetical protein
MTPLPSNLSAFRWISCCLGLIHGYLWPVGSFLFFTAIPQVVTSLSLSVVLVTTVPEVTSVTITVASTKHYLCKSTLSTDKNVKGVGLLQFEIFGTDLYAWEVLYLLEAVEFHSGIS